MKGSPKVLAIVGSTYDITGIATCDDAVMNDSNPSRIYRGCGGAGRNIAENMARMGLNTAIISAYGTDAFSKELLEANRSVGLDVSHCYIEEGATSCMYISLLNKSGELLLAAADLSLLEIAPVSMVEDNADYIRSFDYIFVDTNIPKELLIRIAAVSKGKIFADTVSIHKSVRFCPILDRIDSLKTNRGELQRLSGKSVDTIEEIHAAALSLIEKGVRRVFVTMGPEGSCCCTKDDFTEIPSVPADVKNVTGAGDAFAAATLLGTVQGMSDRDILILGTAASHIALLSPFAVSKEMSGEMLQSTYETIRKTINSKMR